jgi:chloramphenicol 3-O-phosphotransferase
MSRLSAALDDTLAGRDRIVMLVGEPGIGKSRLAEEFATLAREPVADVLWGSLPRACGCAAVLAVGSGAAKLHRSK